MEGENTTIEALLAAASGNNSNTRHAMDTIGREDIRKDDDSDDTEDLEESENNDQESVDSDWDDLDDGVLHKNASNNNNTNNIDNLGNIRKDTMLRHSLAIGGAMNGPKGVIADYKFHQQQERERRNNGNNSNSGNDEDPFMKEWKAKRMQELSLQLSNSNLNANTNTTLFTKLYALSSPESFINAIDEPLLGSTSSLPISSSISSSSITVIIHLYSPTTPISTFTNTALESYFIPRYPLTKFCKMPLALIMKEDLLPSLMSNNLSYSSARNMEELCPILLCYRGGELVGNFVKFTMELKSSSEEGRAADESGFELRELEELLWRKGVLVDGHGGGHFGSGSQYHDKGDGRVSADGGSDDY